MRIIAGDFKGRILTTPKGEHVRPTTDKVKEAVFSMIAMHLEDAVVLDLFAGSGNLGLEALSRGAKHCYFCDRSKESIGLIKKNIAICRVQEQSSVFISDGLKLLERMPEKVDIVFLDPPYENGMLQTCLLTISQQDLLREGGVIIAEHGKEEILPDMAGRFVRIKEKKYGTIRLTLYG